MVDPVGEVRKLINSAATALKPGESVKAQVLGGETAVKVFDGLPAVLQRNLIRKSVRKAAKPVLDRAKANVPVDKGKLKASLKLRALRRTRKFPGRVGLKIQTSGKDSLFAGEQYYGAFQEFGTADIEPSGFLKRAADESKQEVNSIFQAELRARLKESVKEASSAVSKPAAE